jgi:hypothetical protein
MLKLKWTKSIKHAYKTIILTKTYKDYLLLVEFTYNLFIKNKN